jgi:hypothetical protein
MPLFRFPYRTTNRNKSPTVLLRITTPQLNHSTSFAHFHEQLDFLFLRDNLKRSKMGEVLRLRLPVLSLWTVVRTRNKSCLFAPFFIQPARFGIECVLMGL